MGASISVITTKACNACKQVKTLSMFSKDKSKLDGHCGRCKSCDKDYYEKNKDKARAKNSAYYWENRDKMLAYYRENKDKVRIRRQAYRQRNKEKVKAQERVYRQRNKEKAAGHVRDWRGRCRGTIDYALRRLLESSRSRAKAKGLPFDLTREWLETMMVSHCPITLQPIDWLREQVVDGTAGPNSPSIDRIIPELGYVQTNCAIVSFRGNSIKSNGTIDEHRRVVQYMAAQQLRDTEF